MNPLPCPHCHQTPTIESEGFGVFIHCPRCWDGAPDARSLRGSGSTRDEAVEWWNEEVETYLDGKEAA